MAAKNKRLDSIDTSGVTSIQSSPPAPEGESNHSFADPFVKHYPALSVEAVKRIQHDLLVREIELDMQNEELRRKDVELNASLSRYRDFYDLAPVGYCTVSETGLILQANLTTANIFGVDRATLLKRPFSRFVLPDDQEIYFLMRQQTILTRAPRSCDCRLHTMDKKPIWARLDSVLVDEINEHDGKCLRLVISDITERKHSEEVVRRSEKQMMVAQRIGQAGSWTYNLASEEILGSAEALRIFGYPPAAKSFPLKEMLERVAESQRDMVEQSLTKLIADGTEYDLEFSVMPADGSAARITHSVGILERDAMGEPAMVLGFVQDITETRMLEERLRQLAFLDPLTALPNRRLLLDRIGQALAATQRSGDYGAVLYLDLDNFKPLNDKHGHGIGDALLMEVARRLLNCVRAVDTVSRIGGDEFVVLLGDLAIEQTEAAKQARKLAEKIRNSLAQPYLLPGGSEFEPIEHCCSASIGVVLFFKQVQSVEGILKWADAAMYRAKAEGRNRVNFMVERRAKQRL